MSEFKLQNQQQDSSQATLAEAQRNAAQAIESGRSTLLTLGMQNELLEETEDTLESSEHVLQRSMKTLRGMSWSGMVYNMWSEKISGYGKNDANESSVESIHVKDTHNATAPGSSISLNANSTSNTLGSTNMDPALLEIARAAEELKDISLTMGQEIRSQNEKLDNIDKKSSIVHDKTLAVTLKTTQVTNRFKSAKTVKLGRFQFKDIVTGLYLSSKSDGVLVLVRNPTRSTYFNAYVKEGNIFAIQNVKSLKYMATTWTGPIRCTGMNFTKGEECHVIDLKDDTDTAFFFLCNNWGSGGWLKRPQEVIVPESKLSEHTKGAVHRHGKVNVSSKDAAAFEYVYGAVTKNLADKEDMAMFRVKCVAMEQGDIRNVDLSEDEDG
jgi:hypothetical protein